MLKFRYLKLRFQKKFDIFFILGIKKLIYKYSPFFRQFIGGGDGGGGEQFWRVKSTYSDRKILHLSTFQVSYGVLEKLFFLNGPESSEFKTQAWDMYVHLYM